MATNSALDELIAEGDNLKKHYEGVIIGDKEILLWKLLAIVKCMREGLESIGTHSHAPGCENIGKIPAYDCACWDRDPTSMSIAQQTLSECNRLANQGE